MTETGMRYGTVLCGLNLPESSIQEAWETIRAVPQLGKVLQSPVISREEKERAIDRIFPKEIRNFIKTVCRHGNGGMLEEIFKAYRKVYNEKHRIVEARLTCVTEPDEEQKAGIRNLLKERCQAETVILEIKQDKSLIGGFVIEAAGQETDCSLKGRLERLEEKLTRR